MVTTRPKFIRQILHCYIRIYVPIFLHDNFTKFGPGNTGADIVPVQPLLEMLLKVYEDSRAQQMESVLHRHRSYRKNC